ncbi:uridine kinase [Allokutzneria sp. A3M-2-11 16]|uniref:uridine kinase n=1 Tax=Allokutzneria sp. A3M-2-11 16 TaxID=2962043 RepID=UPI0020B86225|nr:uridine kinase [Allokutzneria sp. A3M-2-11 16]MCP3804167.1 uridine kinase [Allokutzneria sp. A3M-2-11 16]
MRVRAVTPERLLEEIAGRVLDLPRQAWVRVAVDGAEAAAPAVLADALVEPLKLGGRAVLRASASGFLRPASLRFEHGRTDPDAFYQDWLDVKGITRELLEPLSPGGSGRVLPSLWDAATDRASRASYVDVPEGGVVVLDGPLLLGQGLPLDLVVHLWLSEAALARRTPPERQWTLGAFARYDNEVDPGLLADLVVRADDPRHPAVVERD